MSAKRLLLVEDSVELAENLAELVLDAGFDAEVVHSAEHALNVLSGQHFDLILSDLRLPQQSGVDLVRDLRARGNQTPVILMSAFADLAAQATARKLGVHSILAKPVDCARLLIELANVPQNAQDLRAEPLLQKD